MNIKVLGLLGAFLFAAPLAAAAAPAAGLTAETYTNLATAPRADAAVASGDTATIDKVWWRGRGWRYGCCRYGWRGYGFRPYYGVYGWRRPYWRRRVFIY